MTESEREALLDRRVMRRLATDREYRNAANAEAQAEREDAITAEEDYRLPPATPSESRWL
jgi:hypothetical protein